MPEFFVIGLPKAMQRRIEARARRANQSISAIWVDKGKKGTPYLLPHPNEAIYSLRAYMDRENAPHILLLPYVVIPEEVVLELDAMTELGMGSFFLARAGSDGWPHLDLHDGFDQDFLDQLFAAVSVNLFGAEELPPAEHLQRLAEGCDRLLISQAAIAGSNELATHRHGFIRKCGDVLLLVCKSQGQVGTLFEFLESHGLDYARTGGITTTIQVFDSAGRLVVSQDSNDHIKQGDKTAPQAAARVYFQTFQHADLFYVAIAYAGPHPDANVTIRFDLPPPP